jgi:hypothetical protein
MTLVKEISKYKASGSVHLENMKDFYENLDIEMAIKHASTGKNPDDKMNPHQWRVGYAKGMLGFNELKNELAEIKKCRKFEDIFLLAEKVKAKIWGLGELWSYDTALRIGFNLKIYPQQVFVHRGVTKGVKKVINGKRPKGRSLPINVFPNELLVLKAYEIENFLCIYGKDNKKSIC